MKALKHYDDSYVNFTTNPKISFNVNKIRSDIISTASGSSYYISVQTPKTKTRSVISSRIKMNDKRNSSKQWSLFKRNNDYQIDVMNRTTHGSFSNSSKRIKKNNSGYLANSKSQKSSFVNPTKLFKNDSIVDQINQSDEYAGYGTYDANLSNKSAKQPDPKTLTQTPIPYPHLAAFINKHAGGYHFGKRMKMTGLQNK